MPSKFLFLMVILPLCAVFGQTSTSSVGPTNSDEFSFPRMSMPFNSSSQTSVLGQFRFEGMQYMTSLPEQRDLTYSQFLSGKIVATHYKKNPGSFNWAADVSVGTFFSLKQSYYSVQEIYMSTPVTENLQATLGRRKFNWTEIDRVWSLGLWQPRYAIDALRPEDQGLTGLFFDYKAEKLQVIAFGSSIFVPTLGPDVREDNGQIKADNRWYRPPSRQSGKISLSYKIDSGDMWNLIHQDSVGGQVRVGDQERGPWASVAAGRMPVNDLVLQRCIRCVYTNSESNFIVSPKVDHHDEFSADAGYQFENLKASVSYYEDHPTGDLPPPDYAIEKLNPIKIYAAQVDWNVEEFLSRPLQLQFAYMKSFGDEIHDIESNGQVSDVTMFTYRYRFSNAALAKVTGPLTTVYARPLITKFSYTYDFDQKGSIFGLEFRYQWNRLWSYILGADIIGSDDINSTSDGFINTYRANDRAYAGASYVF